MTNEVFRLCLDLCNMGFILPFVVAATVFYGREPWMKAACLLLFVMIFNTFLKCIFRVPLMSHLGDGYAFPSGHMHASAVFYGYIFYRVNNKALRAILSVIIVGIGVSLVFCNFHRPTEVVGSVIFAIIELFVYEQLSSKVNSRSLGIFAIVFSVTIMAATFFLYKLDRHVWMALYALLGIIASLEIFDDRLLKSFGKKVSAIMVIILLLYMVNFAFAMLNFGEFYLSELKWIFVPLIIFGTMNIFSDHILLGRSRESLGKAYNSLN